ncbi:hypothetical protein E1091_13460, partial [Micromonospora fluostatini]
IQIGLRDLLYHPTIRELVAAVGKEDPNPPPYSGDAHTELLPPADMALLPAGVASAAPTTELQLGMIYLIEHSGDPQLYQALIGWQVRADFDEPRFRAALDALVARHEALRTSFDLGGFSQPVQLVWSSITTPLTVEVAAGADATEARAAARRWRENTLTLPIDWSQAPLWRCHVVAGDGVFDVTVVMHHAIVDGWSYGRVVVELLRLYHAAAAGAAGPAAGLDEQAGLPPVPAGAHRRFLDAERAALASEAAERYWRQQSDLPPLLFERGPLSGPADARLSTSFAMPAELMRRLRETARTVGVPLKSLGLTAHVWALRALARRAGDIVTGVVVNARPETPGADLVVGPYLNTVPMRIGDTRGTWADTARGVFDAEREGSAYWAYPLARIETGLGRPPFDATFNFTQFQIDRDASGIPGPPIDSWWIEGKPSFAFRVDFDVDVTDAGSRLVVSFDPALLTAAQAELHLARMREALTLLTADPWAHPPATRRPDGKDGR